jgi:hypothetical protein
VGSASFAVSSPGGASTSYTSSNEKPCSPGRNGPRTLATSPSISTPGGTRPNEPSTSPWPGTSATRIGDGRSSGTSTTARSGFSTTATWRTRHAPALRSITYCSDVRRSFAGSELASNTSKSIVCASSAGSPGRKIALPPGNITSP